MIDILEIAFSFLYRNERTATTVKCFVCGKMEKLSVSSIGTNELQHVAVNLELKSMRTFSFLYRNERTATIFTPVRAIAAKNFQFPLSERTNCNSNTLPQETL